MKKICNSSNECTTSISKTFSITVTNIGSSTISPNLNIDFTIEEVYTITYSGFTNVTGLPTTIGTITNNTITFNNDDIPVDINITKSNGVTLTKNTDYTYSSGSLVFLVLPTSDITIAKASTITYNGFANVTGLPTIVANISNDTINLNNTPYNIEITYSSSTQLISGTDYTYNNSTGVITFLDSLSDSITITAIYSITYYLDGGTNNSNNPATYTASDLPITLYNANKTTFDFGGWYDSNYYI